jgi:hypothetical protein
MPQNEGTTRPRRPTRNASSVAEPFRRQLQNVEQGSSELIALLRDNLDRRPYATLGAGLAAGFVLGGGLTLRLATSLAAVAGRMAMANMMSTALRGLQPTTERTDA